MVPQPPLSYEEREGKKAALILMKHSQFDKTLRYIEKNVTLILGLKPAPKYLFYSLTTTGVSYQIESVSSK